MNVTLIGAPAEQVLSLMKRKENDPEKTGTPGRGADACLDA